MNETRDPLIESPADQGRAGGASAALAMTMDALLDPVVILMPVRDGSGRIVDFEYGEANAAACVFHGVTRADLLGRRILHPSSGRVPSPLFDSYVHVVETGEPLVIDGFLFVDDGESGGHFYDARAVAVGGGVGLTWRDATRRVGTENALAASEARYRLLAEHASDVVYESGPDRRVRWVAPSVTRALGWSVAEVVGRDMLDLAHPDDRAEHEAQRDALYAGTPIDQFTRGDLLIRMRTRSGEYRWMTTRKVPLLDDDGVVRGVAGAMRDVDDLVRARETEDSARRAELLTTMSMDASVIGIAIVNADNRFTYANDALCRILGYPMTQLLGRTFVEITHPDDRATSLWEGARLASGEADSFRQRKRYLTGDGGMVWCDLAAAAVRDDRGRLLQVVTQIVDVTAEVRSRELLQATAEEFRLIAENAYDVLMLVRDGLVQWVSPALTRTLGWAPHEWVGHAVAEFAHEDDQAGLVHVERVVDESNFDVSRVRLRDLRGAHVWVELHSGPFVEGSGAVNGAIVSFHPLDETEVEEEITRRSPG